MGVNNRRQFSVCCVPLQHNYYISYKYKHWALNMNTLVFLKYKKGISKTI